MVAAIGTLAVAVGVTDRSSGCFGRSSCASDRSSRCLSAVVSAEALAVAVGRLVVAVSSANIHSNGGAGRGGCARDCASWRLPVVAAADALSCISSFVVDRSRGL